MGFWNGFAPYVRVAEKKARAAKKLAQLQKKNKSIRPVCVQGRAIARNWWGKAWCRNLERYADYENRIGRGRSYLCHGAVLDLQIAPGKVQALVMGSQAEPYRVAIAIDTLSKPVWQAIRKTCAGRIDSIQDLLAGTFPKELETVFMTQAKGLFPTPKQIHFSCSCPDWASMCKHVAAVLYGVGTRLDEEPGLFFVLRAIHIDDLISQAVQASTDKMLQKAATIKAPTINEADLSQLFGIELEQEAAPAPLKRSKTRAAREGQGKQGTKKTKGTKTTQATQPTLESKRTHGTNRTKGTKATQPTRKPPTVLTAVSPQVATDKILALVRRSRKGVDVAALHARTGLSPAQIRNTIFAALRKGLIRRVARGLYAGV